MREEEEEHCYISKYTAYRAIHLIHSINAIHVVAVNKTIFSRKMQKYVYFTILEQLL